MQGKLGIGITGYYKLWVVDEDDTAHLKHEGKNLILNQGMDLMATLYSAYWNIHAHAGNGNRTNKIPSGDSSASVANGWITLSPGLTGLQNFSSSWATSSYGHTSSLFLGDMIKFADGTEVMISGSYSSSVVGGVARFFFTESVSDFSASLKEKNVTVDTQSFTIWKTSQGGLQNTLKRAGTNVNTSSYLTTTNANGTSVNSSQLWVKQWRTYDFSSESISQSYSEVGVGNTVAESTIFSRILLPTTVSLAPKQRLRLRHEFHVDYYPTTSVYVVNAPINGWPEAPADNTNITQSIQRFISSFFTSIASNAVASTPVISSYPALEIPSSNGTDLWGSGNTSSLAAPGSFVSKNTNTLGTYSDVGITLLPYKSWTFELIKYGIFTFSSLNATNIYSIGLGVDSTSHSPASTGCIFAMNFEQTQSKTNTQRLTMYFKWNWNRILQD